MKSQLLITLLVSLFVLLLARDPARYVKKPMDNNIFTNCTAPGGHMSITSLSIIGPVGNVIKVGQFITVIAGYSLDEDVNGGTVDINVEGAVLNITLCDALSYIGLGCPLNKNLNGIFNVTQTMPDVPDGKYNIKVTASDSNNNPLICAEINVQIEH